MGKVQGQDRASQHLAGPAAALIAVHDLLRATGARPRS